MKAVLYHPEARTELHEAVAFYEKRRKGVGKRFRMVVEKELTLIQQLPLLRPVYKDTDFRKSVIRGFPYCLFYLVLDEAIWIAAVAHQKRRPDYWIQRKPG